MMRTVSPRLASAALISVLLLSGCAGSAPAPSPAPTGATSEPTATVAATPTDTPTPTPTNAALAVHRAADGTCTLPAAYAGKDFSSMGTDPARKVIALTFDGGASDAGDDKILRVLKEKDATATFFFTGAFADTFPERVREIAASYPIGNHSYSHPYFTKISDAKITEEIEKAETAIVAASGGVIPVPFFRFPYGDVNAHAIAQVNAHCYVPFRWTIDSLGWQGTATNSANKIVAKVLDKATPGGIVLLHQGDHPTDHSILDADALPEIIDGLRAQGYELVSLEEALRA